MVEGDKMRYPEMESDYTQIKIPEAFRWAVTKRREAEILIYQVITACLENLEDVAIELNKDDDICKFLRLFQNDGLFIEDALDYKENEDTCTLSCSFDVYGIREDLQTMNDVLFGTIPMDIIESCLDSDSIEISEDRVRQRQNAIQKVKHVGEVSQPVDTKKDN